MFPVVSGNSLLVFVYTMLGDLERATARLELVRIKTDEMDPKMRITPLAASAYLNSIRGQRSAAVAALEEALALGDAQTNDVDLLIVAMAAGETWFMLEDFQRSASELDRFLQRFELRGSQASLPVLKYMKGRSLLAMGEFAEAQTILSEARRVAELLDTKHTLWQIYVTQSNLARKQGEGERARSLGLKAAALIREVSHHLDDPGLQASFMQSTPVRAALRD
jgi:ATP/maltotriose-dependent transcriptional regulator MalT